MAKWIFGGMMCLVLWAGGKELPFGQWRSSGPHDEIAGGQLILRKFPVAEHRPEVFQYVANLAKGEIYEVLFTACLPKAGGGLELHVDFADDAHYTFLVEAQNTVWNTYRYEFKAGEGSARVTFLLSTGGEIPNEAWLRNVIIRPRGELLSPAFQRKGNLRIGREYLSYDIEPDRTYRLRLEAAGKFIWKLELLDCDREAIGHVGGEGVLVDKTLKFPQQTTFLKLTLTSGGAIAKMTTVSLRKVYEEEK